MNKHLNGRGSITVVPFVERNTMLVVIIGFQRFVSRFDTARAVVLGFASSRYNWEFWPKNGKIWPKICICGNFGPHFGIFGPFGAIPGQKPMR